MTVVFLQSSTHGVQVGDPVRVAMRTMPGSTFETTVMSLPLGTSEGMVDVRDRLPTLRELAGGFEYVAVLEIPSDLKEPAIRLGSSGTALRITDGAGGALFWRQSCSGSPS